MGPVVLPVFLELWVSQERQVQPVSRVPQELLVPQARTVHLEHQGHLALMDHQETRVQMVWQDPRA